MNAAVVAGKDHLDAGARAVDLGDRDLIRQADEVACACERRIVEALPEAVAEAEDVRGHLERALPSGEPRRIALDDPEPDAA